MNRRLKNIVYTLKVCCVNVKMNERYALRLGIPTVKTMRGLGHHLGFQIQRCCTEVATLRTHLGKSLDSLRVGIVCLVKGRLLPLRR